MERKTDDISYIIRKAIEARRFSYSPYSGFSVGAAIECVDGSIYTGCNIENAAYGPSNCAERTAVFKAVSEGKKDFKRIAIVGGKTGESTGPTPCGVCRQVLSEFCGPDLEVIAAKSEEDYSIFTLGDLLPEGFKLQH